MGLCNGIRLFVENRRLFAHFATGSRTGETVIILRVNLICEDTEAIPLKWRRQQFPVKPAFALTINKVQGQTLKKVAVRLEEPVFTHGQFYVAASRVSDPEQFRFYVRSESDRNGHLLANNFVFQEVLIDS